MLFRSLVINVGAGEGYYAVGFAERMAQSRVICFETLEKNRIQINELASRNGVADRLDIRGQCTAEILGQAIGTETDVVIFCDAEGHELELLQPALVSRLKSASIVVELHDAMLPGVSKEIEARFKSSHRIVEIWSQPRSLKDWPEEVDLPRAKRKSVLDESRGGPMNWFWMTPK